MSAAVCIVTWVYEAWELILSVRASAEWTENVDLRVQ